MTGSPAPVSWYLGRDGQQYGPLSDAELRKLAEMRHLKQGDLVWRDGMKEWRPALTMFPPPQPAPMPPPQAAAPPPPPERPAAAMRPPAAPAPQPNPAQGQPFAQRPPPPPVAPPSPPQGIAPGPAPMQTFVRADPPPPSAGPASLRVEPRTGPAGAPQQAMPAPARGGPPAPALQRAHGPADDLLDDFDEAEEKPRRRGGWKRAVTLLFFLSTLSAATWFAYPHRSQIMNFVVNLAPKADSTSVATTESGTSPTSADPKALSVSPLEAAGATADAADSHFQRTALWRILKREFPEWYSLQLKQAVELHEQKKEPAQVAEQMARSLAALRRQYASQALQASPPRLIAIARAFVENLAHLKKHSTEACYGYIAQGETNSVIVSLMRSPEHTRHLQGHAAAIFEAIAEGRKVPRAHVPPKQADFDALVAELTARGWSQADLQLFSDEKALARSSQEKVCQMVHQWFEAQLALKDEEARQRLLADTLKPIVQG
jgi:GYF domain 2